MLIPKEHPYLLGLNSYYIDFKKFIEHLQGEIGSGCLYCQAVKQEILVYFDEREIIRAVIQYSGKQAQVSKDLDSVLQVLSMKNFLITVYYLDSASIFYWGEMPAFQRKRVNISVKDITFPNLVSRLHKMAFSGFVDIEMGNKSDSAIIFFHKGERRGGSYSWGKGGLSLSEGDFDRLLITMEDADTADYAIGSFIVDDNKVALQEETPENSSVNLEEEQYLSDLVTAIKELLDIYIKVIKKKIKIDPVIQLKQKFLDSLDEYPFLDPFTKFFQLTSDGEIEFAANVNRKQITEGIVDCIWRVIKDNKLEQKFTAAILQWDYKDALEERGIRVIP